MYVSEDMKRDKGVLLVRKKITLGPNTDCPTPSILCLHCLQ
jgi:hypothetical protein